MNSSLTTLVLYSRLTYKTIYPQLLTSSASQPAPECRDLPEYLSTLFKIMNSMAYMVLKLKNTMAPSRGGGRRSGPGGHRFGPPSRSRPACRRSVSCVTSRTIIVRELAALGVPEKTMRTRYPPRTGASECRRRARARRGGWPAGPD